MKWIKKTNEPVELTQWRAKYQNDINYNYSLLRQNHTVTKALTDSLIEEQGWLCAYTGKRIELNSCHIEHLKPQTHCELGQDVDYNNLVACFPQPNTKYKLPYGAHYKDKWPSSEQKYLLVSPLMKDCESRFIFNLKGVVTPIPNDTAAAETIKKLNLTHPELTALRESAIKAVLGPTNNLSLKDARVRLKSIEDQTTGKLEPYCFVIKQALKKHIIRLEFISKSKKEKQSNSNH